jgi:hypothetical protein
MAVVLGMGNHSNSKSPSIEVKSSSGTGPNFELWVVSACAEGRREAKAGKERILYKRDWMARI